MGQIKATSKKKGSNNIIFHPRTLTRIVVVVWCGFISYGGYILSKFSSTLNSQTGSTSQQAAAHQPIHQQNISLFGLTFSPPPRSSMSSSDKKDVYIYHPLRKKKAVKVLTKNVVQNTWKQKLMKAKERIRKHPELCAKYNHSVLHPDHGCEVNNDTLAVFCNFNNLRVDNTKVSVSQGGEDLKDVMGRAEETEMPKYEPCAFYVPTKPIYNVPMDYRLFYIEDVLKVLEYPKSTNSTTMKKEKNPEETIDATACHHLFKGTTLFIARYDYVNLYHTLTDLWNAYFVLPREQRLQNNANIETGNETDAGEIKYFDGPHQIVFLDGHAKGSLDDLWRALYGDFHYIRQLPKDGVCFDRAIFIPTGYSSPLFHRIGCFDNSMAREFSNFAMERFNIDPNLVVPQRGRIIIIDRQHYVSHPRSSEANSHQMSRQVNNLGDVRDELMKKVPGATRVDLVRLEVLDTFADQIRVIRQAHVVVAMHGAALSHLMFMDGEYETEQRRKRKEEQLLGGIIGDDVVQPAVVEMFVEHPLDFFQEMARWKGVKHQYVPVDLTDTRDLKINSIELLIESVKNALV